MLLIRTGLPEEGELLLCEVKKVHFHSVFVKILEYGMEGMIHISEIAPGRIRNIRDYVREGKYIVCKVLRIDQVKHHVDLSLRRVNERERRGKTNQISLENRAESIVEHVAKITKMDGKEFYLLLTKKLFEDYDFLYDAFLDVSEGKLDLSKIGIPDKQGKALQEAVVEKVKPPITSIKGKLELSSFSADGVEVIKNGVKKLNDEVKGGYEIRYDGAGAYSLIIEGPDFEYCEKLLKKILKNLEDFFSKHDGEVNFEKK